MTSTNKKSESVFNKTYCDTSTREDSATKKFNQSATITTFTDAPDSLRRCLAGSGTSILVQDAPSTDDGPRVRFAIGTESQQGKKVVPVYKNVDVPCEEAVNFALAIIFAAVDADEAFRKQLAELEKSLQRRREVVGTRYTEK